MNQKKFFVVLFFIIFFSRLNANNNINSIVFNNEIDSAYIKSTILKDSIKNQPSDDKEKNLIVNGNFEDGNKYFYSGLEFSSQAVVPGNYTVTNNASSHNSAFYPIKDHTSGSGNYLIIDASTEENIKNWCSKVKVDPKSEYQFSLYASNLNVDFRYPATIKLMVNGEEAGHSVTLPDSHHEWTKYTWRWFSGNTKDTVDFCIEDSETTSNGNDYGIDDIVLTKISQEVVIPKEICPPVGDTLVPAIHFPFNESTITDYSKEKIKSLLDLLTKCPKMKITIAGHTDPYGTNAYNDKLSGDRAKAILDYLRSNGIEAQRMSTIAYGERKKVYHGTSIKDNVKNRRVRFIVSGYLE
jgi:outer membrane protein OmpA-like peptidoglycan-associated protein